MYLITVANKIVQVLSREIFCISCNVHWSFFFRTTVYSAMAPLLKGVLLTYMMAHVLTCHSQHSPSLSNLYGNS